ncbi:hypothetical protein IIA94_00760 [Patescibacteria group bacterium]|nr:hypothetical protein [Patescibacteria group bacterium]
MKIPASLRSILPHRNGTHEVSGAHLIKDLEAIEKFVGDAIGVEDVLVSVKTNSERERFIQVRIFSTNRYKGSEEFKKLKRRIARLVSPRVGIPKPNVQVMRMRFPSIVESERGPPSC